MTTQSKPSALGFTSLKKAAARAGLPENALWVLCETRAVPVRILQDGERGRRYVHAAQLEAWISAPAVPPQTPAERWERAADADERLDLAAKLEPREPLLADAARAAKGQAFEALVAWSESINDQRKART